MEAGRVRRLHQDGVVLLPDHLSYEEGATLPAVTALLWVLRNRAAVRNRWSFDLCAAICQAIRSQGDNYLQQ